MLGTDECGRLISQKKKNQDYRVLKFTKQGPFLTSEVNEENPGSHPKILFSNPDIRQRWDITDAEIVWEQLRHNPFTSLYFTSLERFYFLSIIF